MKDEFAELERDREGQRLSRQFVLDTIAAMNEVGDTEASEYLDSMLRFDGPDLDGCVSSLGKHGLVTQQWADRLTTINDIFDDLHEELAELKGYLAEQSV
ncbi:hypothetical protein [Actinomyces culturomici]|uniref:hypothetical protein n=1 Tax=Actinomyces culturomici TaxID=1926276 RepID=UPI000E2044AD|nr:hypothetical protein [Actinomyces culturomici]